MMNIKKLTASLGFISCLVSTGFSTDYKLYSESSDKSKIVATITPENQGEYIGFYTDKDGKWAKYANSTTGEVGWVDLGEIEQQKADALRKVLLKNVDEQVTYHNNKLSTFAELRGKINKANYQELQQYSHPSNVRGMIHFFNSWLGDDGKIHEL